MTPLAHHAGEQTLATLLLLTGGGSLSLLAAIARAHLATTRTKLTRRMRSPRGQAVR